MRRKLLTYLVCPDCQDNLDLKEEILEHGRIKEGKLVCLKCNAQYSISNFIPRFVETDPKSDLGFWRNRQDTCKCKAAGDFPTEAYLTSTVRREIAENAAVAGRLAISNPAKVGLGTDKYVDTFSFEWSKFHDVQMDILNNTDESERTFKWETGWKPKDIKGKLILDVGVGAGRFADVVSKWGGEVIGIDLSSSVDVAYKNIGQRENIHIINADLFNLPFRKETFDHVYSIGVLHHSPDTERAFKTIIPYLKKGGELAVFLYAYGHYHYLSDVWRKITTRLPMKIVYYLSTIAVPLYYIHKIPFFGKALQFLLPTANWPDRRWRWLDTFDWYTPKYQWKHTWPEVYRWFREEGFIEIELYQEDKDSSLAQICMRGRKGGLVKSP